jgi:hypothetical protein
MNRAGVRHEPTPASFPTSQGRKDMKRSSVIRFVGCFAVALLAACSSTPSADAGAGGGADPSAIQVQVTNAVVPPVSITVWMQPETGSRRRLGNIAPNGQATFSYNPSATGSEHRLVAEHVGGGSTTSNPFTLTGVTRLTWQTSSPTVQTGR